MPRRWSCQQASLPARPAPTTVTRAVMGSRRLSLEVAVLVTAEHHPALLLRLFFEEPGAATIGTGLAQRTVIGGELALGIALAAIEAAPPAALALDHRALAALRAGHPDLLGLLLLDVLAIGIVGAGDEGAEATPPPHQVAAALRAFLVDRGEFLDLEPALGAAYQALGGLALGVVRAGQERPEATLLDDHRLRVLAPQLLDYFLVDVGYALASLAGELARVLALGVGGAGEELPVTPPLQDHRGAALVADLVGFLLHGLDVLHLRLSLLQILGELAPEQREGVEQVVLALLDRVQLLLHGRGVLDVHDVLEMLDQQVGHQEAQLRGMEPAIALLDVLARLDRGDDGRVGRGPADAVLLELLHQARFAEAGRRLGKVLVGVELLERERVALCEGRQLLLGFLRLGRVLGERLLLQLGRALLVRSLLVDRQKALELQRGALGAEQIHRRLAGVRSRGRLDVHHRLVVDGGPDLRGDEAVPNQFVQLVLVFRQETLDALRVSLEIRRSDRLVGVLGVLLRAIEDRLLGKELRAIARFHARTNRLQRVVRDAGRIGPHVGDETHRAVGSELDAFIEPLGDLHRPLHPEAQLLEGLLLQLRGDEGRHGVAAPLLALDPRHAEAPRLEVAAHGFGRRGVSDLEVLAVLLDEVRAEHRRLPGLEVREHGPVLFGDEGSDLALAVADQFERHRLHPPRRQSAPYFVPKDRAHLVAHQTVQDAARLLRVHLLGIHLARVLEGLLDGAARDLIEDHPTHLLLGSNPEFFLEMPADRLSLAVRIGRQVDGRRVLGGGLELVQDPFARCEDLVVGCEPLLDVDAQLLPGEIPNVPHGGLHHEVPSEIFVDRLRLGGGLDDHEVLRHRLLPYTGRRGPDEEGSREARNASPHLEHCQAGAEARDGSSSFPQAPRSPGVLSADRRLQCRPPASPRGPCKAIVQPAPGRAPT